MFNSQLSSIFLYLCTAFIMKRAYLFIILAILLCSCEERHQPSTTPWGTSTDDNCRPTSLESLQSAGEMIVLTVSGPDSYFDYHGRGMGTQYLMIEEFAKSIGVAVRVELCRDTTEMLSRLAQGDGDVISCQIKNPNDKRFLPCGHRVDSLHTSWLVRADEEDLAKAVDNWYNPSRLSQIVEKEQHYYSRQLIRPRVGAPVLNAAKGTISRYDALFQRYASLCRADWRLLAAISYQESGFDPQATSWAGACGLMQLMPATARHLGISTSQIYDPETNISGAARLLAQLFSSFSDVPNADERVSFTLAAYNGGSGHVRDAMSLARKHGGNATRWSEVAPYILRLSEPRFYLDPVVRNGYMRGTETYNYVIAVRNRWNQYRGMAPAGGGGFSLGGGDATPRRSNKNHRFRQ